MDCLSEFDRTNQGFGLKQVKGVYRELGIS